MTKSKFRYIVELMLNINTKSKGTTMNETFTNNELKLMNLFWEIGRPLTSVDVLELLKEENWKQSYAVRLLNILEHKRAIAVCGAVRYRTQYARQFHPIITREEYAARLALTTGIGKNSIANVTVALVKEASDAEDFYQELENIIAKLEEEKHA